MKKGLVLILIFVLAFVSAACGEGESLPSASDAAAVQSASASAVLPPAKNESGAQNSVDSNISADLASRSIYPVFYIEGCSLLCVESFEADPVQICREYIYTYAGAQYNKMKYYRGADILYYTSGYFVEDGLIYAQLRQFSGGVDSIVADNVLLESIVFSELTPSVLYTVHHEHKSTLYYRLRFDTQLVDEDVYKGYFIYGYSQVVYLKDTRGAENIKEALRNYPGANAYKNPYADYGLYYYDTVNLSRRIGSCGEIFSINQTTGTIVAGRGTAQYSTIYDTVNSVNISSFNMSQSSSYNLLDNVLMDWWSPDKIYQPMNYVMVLEDPASGMEKDLYRLDASACECIARRVINGRYVSSDNGAYAFSMRLEGKPVLYVAYTDGTQLLLPTDMTIALEDVYFYSFTSGAMVYAIDRYAGLVKMYFYGEPVMTMLGEKPVNFKYGNRFVAYSMLNDAGSGYDIYIDDNSTNNLYASGATVSQSGSKIVEDFWVSDGKTVLYLTIGRQNGLYTLNKSASPGSHTALTDCFLPEYGLLFSQPDASELAFNISRDGKNYIVLLNGEEERLIEGRGKLVPWE